MMIIYYQSIRPHFPRNDNNVIHASFVRPSDPAHAPETGTADIIDLGYFRAQKIIRDIEAEYLRHYPYFF